MRPLLPRQGRALPPRHRKSPSRVRLLRPLTRPRCFFSPTDCGSRPRSRAAHLPERRRLRSVRALSRTWIHQNVEAAACLPLELSGAEFGQRLASPSPALLPCRPRRDTDLMVARPLAIVPFRLGGPSALCASWGTPSVQQYALCPHCDRSSLCIHVPFRRDIFPRIDGR